MSYLIFLTALQVSEAKKSKGTEEVSAKVTEQAKPNKKKANIQNVPKDKVSEAYATALIETTGRGFSPNAMGLTYQTITFAADNSWSAEGLVSVMDEEMDCVEKGTWMMDPAQSETSANMTWTVTSTDCPSRVAPIEMRLQLILTGTEAGINANFR